MKLFSLLSQRRTKTPTLLQMEGTECGAAALGIVLAYYKCFIPLEELRVACGVSRDGSTAFNIKRAAATYGLEARVFQRASDALTAGPFPLIVLWNFNHFLVVEGFVKNKVYINDPAQGPYTLTCEEFERHYSQIVITLEKTETFYEQGAPPRMWKGVIERIEHVKKPLLFLLLAGFGAMLTNAVIPLFSKVFFDVILGLKIYGWGAWFTVLFCSLIALFALFSILQAFILTYLNGKLAVQFSARYLWHILRLPLVFYQQRFGGEIAYRLSLNDEIINQLTGRLAGVVLNSAFIIFYAVVMLWYSVPIALVGIAAVIINLAIMVYTQRARTDAFTYLQQSTGKYLGFAIGGLNSMETIKSISGENSFFSRISGYFSEMINTEQKLGKKNIFLVSVPEFLSLATKATLFGVGGYLIIYEGFTLGLFMAMQALLMNFMSPVAKLTDLATIAQTVHTNIVRLDDVLKNPIDPIFSESKEKSAEEAIEIIEGFLELRDVSFGYSPLNPPLIENLNLKISPGQRIALVGGSGCGKTTIARLINGLLQPWSGAVYIDGKMRSELTREEVTQSLTTVDQEIFLFLERSKITSRYLIEG